MIHQIEVPTQAHDDMIDITGQVQQAIAQSGIRTGSCRLFVPHTTAGLTLNDWRQVPPSKSQDLMSAW